LFLDSFKDFLKSKPKSSDFKPKSSSAAAETDHFTRKPGNRFMKSLENDK